MADGDPEIKEHEVADWPGWTKIVINNSRRYRSPGGADISAARFMKLALKYKGQKYIPESAILEDVAKRPGNTAPGFFKEISSAKKKSDSPDDIPRQQDISEIIEDNEPRPKPTSMRSKHPRPTAAVLAIGFKKLLLLITAYIIAGMVVHDDRAALSEEEATIVGIALGNLLEHSKINEDYGWLIAETGDWQALGYVAIRYFGRLNDIRKERVAAAKQQKQGAPQQQQYQPQPTSSNGNQPGAPVPFINRGIVTPVGVGNQLREA